MIGEDTVPNHHENEHKTSPAHESPEHKTAVDKREKDGSDSEADGAEEILEESPCKRWSKRREKVKQRDVPGIDAAYLAMDNETGMLVVCRRLAWRRKCQILSQYFTGNEVVWNEVQFSERKNFREQEVRIPDL